MSGRAVIAHVAATQWGLITTAQAHAAGTARLTLSRMAEAGELERVLHGVYATPAAAGEDLTDVRARWLAIDPTRTAEERLQNLPTAGVITHTSAAALHRIGDLLSDDLEVALPQRFRSRHAIRARKVDLAPETITLVDGLPVTTPERTIADLIDDGQDLTHVADAMADALRSGQADLDRLEQALDKVGDGEELLEKLLTLAGLDIHTLGASAVGFAINTGVLEAISRQVVETFVPILKQQEALMAPAIEQSSRILGEIARHNEDLFAHVTKRYAEVLLPLTASTGLWMQQTLATLGNTMPKIEVPTLNLKDLDLGLSGMKLIAPPKPGNPVDPEGEDQRNSDEQPEE